jgi:hypothetical protein
MSSHDRICACVSEIDRRDATAGLPGLDTPLEARPGGSTTSKLGGFYGKQKFLLRGTVCVTGGTQVESSNITLVFGAPASGHFGSQPINGAVRVRK